MNRFTYFHSLAIAAVMLSITGSLVFADPLTLIEEGQPREDDIRAGKSVSDQSRLMIDVTRLRKEP